MQTVNCTGLEQQEKNLKRPIPHLFEKTMKSHNSETKDFMQGTLEIKGCIKCLDVDLTTRKYFCNIINEKYDSYLENIAIKYLQYPLLSPSLQLQLK